MSAWPRLLVASVLSGALVASLPARPAHAQPERDQAEKLNDEGKVFLTATPMQPADAADRFQKAIDLVQDGRYYANLCLALYHTGKLGEALKACRAVAPHGGDERAVKQADNLIEKAIKPKMREAGIDPDAPPPTDGGNGTVGDGTDGNGTPTGPVDASNFTVAPPPSLLEQKAAPKHEYTWTLGAQLMGASVAFGSADAYESTGSSLRITGDYLIVPKIGVGVLGLLQWTQVGEGVFSQPLSVVDFGIGAYKDLCFGRVCLKPTVGAGISLFQTQEMSDSGRDSLAGLSVRGEVTGAYAFGARFQHLITATIGGAGYTKPVGEYETDPEVFGLDKPGSAVYFGLGYTRRFNTPFGSSPFFVVQ